MTEAPHLQFVFQPEGYRRPYKPQLIKVQSPLERQVSLQPNGAELRTHGVVD